MSFIAYDVTKELVTSLRTVVPTIAKHNKDLADQLYRAASSILLNLAEGQKFQNGNRQKHYAIAHGSANEVRAALDTAEAWGWLATRGPERELADRVLALLWKLTRSESARTPPRNRPR